MERKEAYAKIKELNLQEECKKKYGKNFTQCKTNELKHIIDSAKISCSKSVKKKECECGCGDKKDLKTAFKELLEILGSRHILSHAEVNMLLGY